MISQIKIQELQPGEEKTASKLVVDVFNIFVAPGYSDEGIKTFLDYVQPDQISQRRELPDHLYLIAIACGRTVGVIEIRESHHVSLFFVAEEYQGKGIARALLQEALAWIKEHNPELIPLTVNSSPYAVPIYQKFGFAVTSEQQLTNGILYQPMKLELL